ncbi:MAG: F0F1 ATP synthase subunit A [Cyanobacteria bacterium]|jgi:F-type H+-transporting ATPase subunit a|nr:F0F1 ATP synthase subunit A [Cyanobacteriota bacterium]
MDHFWKIELAGLPVHMNTLIMVWASMAVILVFAVSLVGKLKVQPSKSQTFAESLYDLCRGITFSTAGKRGDGYLFYIGSLFLFILVANLLGQLPLRMIELPEGELMAATGDFNTPAALAILTLIMYFAIGIKTKGFSYFKHYFSPYPVFLPLNLLEDVTRPGALMLRLFFNIFVGEILTMIVYSIAPWVAPVAVTFLELFVAVIQAYIFTILSAVYIGLMSETHDHDTEHH